VAPYKSFPSCTFATGFFSSPSLRPRPDKLKISEPQWWCGQCTNRRKACALVETKEKKPLLLLLLQGPRRKIRSSAPTGKILLSGLPGEANARLRVGRSSIMTDEIHTRKNGFHLDADPRRIAPLGAGRAISQQVLASSGSREAGLREFCRSPPKEVCKEALTQFTDGPTGGLRSRPSGKRFPTGIEISHPPPRAVWCRRFGLEPFRASAAGNGGAGRTEWKLSCFSRGWIGDVFNRKKAVCGHHNAKEFSLPSPNALSWSSQNLQI